jgi:hypothetical protein
MVPVSEVPEATRVWERQLRDAADTLMGARKAAQAPTDHRGETIVATFEVDLALAPSDRARVAAHLAQSARMIRSAYEAGRFHEPTEAVIDTAERIAAAIADSSGRAAVSFRLDEGQCRQIHRWLSASRERAGDLEGAAETIARVQREWDLCSGYSPRREAAEAARPPRAALDSGGWAPAR